MNEQTKLILRAIQGILIEARTPAGPRIFANRFHPIQGEELPATIVHSLDSTRTIRDHSPRVYDVRLRVAIVSFVRPIPPPAGNPPRKLTADELLADMGQAVEDALRFDQHLLGTAEDCYFLEDRIEPIEVDGIGMAAGQQVLEVKFHLESGEGPDPRTLFDLETVTMRWGPKAGPVLFQSELTGLPRPGPSDEGAVGG